MKLTEIKATSIITKSNLPDADYVINPYTGCMHNCVYCYARFMKRFAGHEEPWGEFIDVKINAPELIPSENSSQAKKYFRKKIFLSSVTDAYQPLDRKYQLTRRILEKLIPLKPALSILTKSDLVLRDIDLLKQFENCDVGFSISSLDDNLRKELEPFTSTVANKIKALEELKKSWITTFVFIGPILPFFTDWKKIILETRHCVDYYMLENLNVKGTIWDSVEKWLKEKHPEHLGEYQLIYSSSPSKNNYWNPVEREVEQFCKEQGVECNIYFHHDGN